MTAREVQIAHEDVTWIRPRRIVITVTSEWIAVLTPVPTTVVLLIVSGRSWSLDRSLATAPLIAIVDAIVWLAPVVIAWIVAVKHVGALPHSSRSFDDNASRL